MKIKKSFFGILLILYAITMVAQQKYILLPKTSTGSVTGTSTFHNWKMIISEMQSKMIVGFDNGAIRNIRDVSFTVKSASIKGDEKGMNEKAQIAMKSDKYAEIKFNSLGIINLDIKSNGAFGGIVTGNLFIAGTTKQITMPFQGIVMPAKTIKIYGMKSLVMSDYGVIPPIAALGVIKAGDKIDVYFTLEYCQQ